MKIFWTDFAEVKLTSIVEFLGGENDPVVQDWLSGLFKSLANIQNFPKMGRIIPEFGNPNVREILYKKYRIIYKLEVENILILTIRHSRQKPVTKKIFDA